MRDPRAVLLLSDMKVMHYLSPFLNDAHTLTGAARALGCSPSTIAYWVPRFVETGLLEVLEVRQRAGMAMRVYRAPGRELVVPFADIPFDRRVALLDGGRMRVLRRFLDGIDEEMERDGRFALGFSSDRPKGFSVNLVETDSQRARRPYVDGWMRFELTEADALEMARELEALIERYADRSGPKRYVAHLGIAADPRHRWRSAKDAHTYPE